MSSSAQPVHPHGHRHFLPAAGVAWALPFYDPFARLSGADRLRRELIASAGVRSGHRVLDVGCGTGTLLGDVAKAVPGVVVTGLDPDPAALARARRKLDRAGVAARLDEGYADALPYADASFDRVFSSLMFHHLDAAGKAGMLREIHRVLAPGGSLHLMDFAGPSHGGLFHRSPRLADNDPEHVVAMMKAAGFAEAAQAGERRVWLGPIAWYRAA